MAEFVIISGMSGAGRSQAADALEDRGWFVVDNLPHELIGKVAELVHVDDRNRRVALAVNILEGRDVLAGAIQDLRDRDHVVHTVFLDAGTPTLIRRYESTKRSHPLAGEFGLARAIEAERELLSGARAGADVLIDTSDYSVHDLKRRIAELFDSGPAGSGALRVTVLSFGFAHGVPPDADLVFDWRCLPNPHWVEELRPFTGRDAPVAEYLAAQEVTPALLESWLAFLALLVPAYRDDGRSYLTIASGCTGGHHRSVFMTERVAAWLREQGIEPHVVHRDIER